MPTRTYAEHRFNHDTWRMESVARWSFSTYPGNNSILTVSRNGVTKTVEVRERMGFTYRLMRDHVEADGGAEGLFRFLDDCLFHRCMEVLAWKVLRHCLYNCKEAA